ncbi:MAG: TPMT family class I SAM-dependent methyltransferase [Crocinitomicaceae bacterium]|nr:TPMT family class I SAM-dependent methyltransferase [Crocinitomicaceae bacterium]
MIRESKEFWSRKYRVNETGWDLGQVSTPIKEYFDQVDDKELKILIPGCGNGHEAEYLYLQGFTNVNIIDLVEEPLESFKNRIPEFPKANIHLGDFFDHSGCYDIIVEQTMFCAINPTFREAYVQKVYDLLNPKGKMIGVMFSRHFESGPPYGGDKEEYLKYFKRLYKFVQIEECFNSVGPRQGNEYFIKLQKN